MRYFLAFLGSFITAFGFSWVLSAHAEAISGQFSYNDDWITSAMILGAGIYLIVMVSVLRDK